MVGSSFTGPERSRRKKARPGHPGRAFSCRGRLLEKGNYLSEFRAAKKGVSEKGREKGFFALSFSVSVRKRAEKMGFPSSENCAAVFILSLCSPRGRREREREIPVAMGSL
jgi:hypothetical protein